MSRTPYPPAYREQILRLHRSGRSVASLAREYEPTATTIHNWIKKSASDGESERPLSDDERAELKRLRRKVEQLQMEREILEKATAWFAQKTGPTSHSGS
jgi:transposase